MNSSWQAAVDSFIVREKLPPGYLHTVEHWFVPLAEDLLRKAAVSHRTLIVGISGSQGSGKSTLAALLVVLLRELMGLRSINLSLDDFYHTHPHRQNWPARFIPCWRLEVYLAPTMLSLPCKHLKRWAAEVKLRSRVSTRPSTIALQWPTGRECWRRLM